MEKEWGCIWGRGGEPPGRIVSFLVGEGAVKILKQNVFSGLLWGLEATWKGVQKYSRRPRESVGVLEADNLTWLRRGVLSDPREIEGVREELKKGEC